MAKFRKGQRKPPASGRRKGTPNKSTAAVRAAFVEAFHEVNDGATALAEWGRENPEKFYPLAARFIPLDMTSGDKSLAPIATAVIHVPIPMTMDEWEAANS